MFGRASYGILVSSKLIVDSVEDKKTLDAVAFAVLIKMTFCSSMVVNATYRKLNSTFGISNKKLKELTTKGVELGLLRWEGKNLIANSKLKSFGAVGNYRIRFNHQTTACHIISDGKSSTKVVKSTIKLNHIARELRKFALMEGVKRSNFVEDSSFKATEEYASSFKSRSEKRYRAKECRKAKKRNLRVLRYDYKHNRISVPTLGKLSGVSASTARGFKSELISDNLLSEKHNYEQTPYKVEELNYSLRAVDKNLGGKGFLTLALVDGSPAVVRRLANSYRADCSIVVYKRKSYV